MPFKVQYEIYDSKHKAPVLSTFDRTVASIEFNDLIRRGGDVYRMVQTPMADGALTKQEEYLMLVYRVRKLWRQYFDQGRSQEVLLASLEKEKELDDWNTRTAAYMRAHPHVPIERENLCLCHISCNLSLMYSSIFFSKSRHFLPISLRTCWSQLALPL